MVNLETNMPIKNNKMKLAVKSLKILSYIVDGEDLNKIKCVKYVVKSEIPTLQELVPNCSCLEKRYCYNLGY